MTIKLGLAGLMLLGVSACGSPPGSADAGASAAPAIAVTAKELSAAFQENEAKAKITYDGKPLKITGVVKDIDLSMGDAPVIKLRGANEVYGMGATKDGKMTDVMLSGITNEVAAELKKGKSAVFDCSGVSEIMGSAQVSECTLVK